MARDADGDRALCRDPGPCDYAYMEAAARTGANCTWSSLHWLPAARDQPMVLFDVESNGYVWYSAGRWGNESTGTWRDGGSYFQADVDGGTWWRLEAEHVRLTIDVPCDVYEIVAAFNYRAETLFGEEYRLSPHFEIILDPARAEGMA